MAQASEVYARLLLPKKLGFPLWTPEPDDNLPDQYCEIGVSIGDVGILKSDGDFDFLFSICVPFDDPINHRGVPDDFEDVSALIETSKRDGFHSPRTAITSASMKYKDIRANISVQDNSYVYTSINLTFISCPDLHFK